MEKKDQSHHRAKPASISGQGQQQREKSGDSSKPAASGGSNKPQATGPTPSTTTAAAVSSKAPRLALFDHLTSKLPQSALSQDTIDGDKSIHPITLKIGIMFRKGLIREDDDRVAALLSAFVTIIKDYKTPPNKALSWDLDRHIRAQVTHLVACRQHSIGMGNLIKFLRYSISRIPSDISEADAKKILLGKLNTFLEERILYSREVVTQICIGVIKDGDVLMTFGSSPLLRQIFQTAAKEQKVFKLVIVDTRPLNDGLLTLQALSPLVQCVYTTLAGAASLMSDVTKVIIGASALLSNGAMLAPAGTAMVAALAQTRDVPVIVACEGYKFCEKVQVDAIVYNELGSPQEIAVAALTAEGLPGAAPQHVAAYRGGIGATGEGDQVLPFQVINLRYDLTPIRNISVVATETGLIPPTSIPVLLREFKAEASAASSAGRVDSSTNE